MSALPEGYVVAYRECPRCGKADDYKVPSDALSMVQCKCCQFRFEIGSLRRRPKVGSPTNPNAKFDYEPAASHQTTDGLRKRLRQYARMSGWWQRPRHA